MNKKIKLSLVALIVIVITFGFSYAVGFSQTGMQRGSGLYEQSDMTNVIEQANYSTWLEYMQKNRPYSRMLDIVNEDNFDLFAEMHKAMEDGDFDRVQEIREELGIEGYGSYGMGQKRGYHRGGKLGGCLMD